MGGKTALPDFERLGQRIGGILGVEFFNQREAYGGTSADKMPPRLFFQDVVLSADILKFPPRPAYLALVRFLDAQRLWLAELLSDPGLFDPAPERSLGDAQVASHVGVSATAADQREALLLNSRS